LIPTIFHERTIMSHKFDPDKMAKLDSDERRKQLAPGDLLTSMGLKPGDSFLDSGAGTGFFTFSATVIVGTGGRVVAVDTNSRMIAELNRKKSLAGPVPLSVIQSAEYALPVESETMDFALIAFVLHEIEDKARFLIEALRTIKSNGLLGVVEWAKKPMNMGPPLGERLSMDETVSLMAMAGCAIVKQNEAADEHYFAVGRKLIPL
jgi:ubiquinone/menaquinone biosynthesis C-methylase UbiE